MKKQEAESKIERKVPQGSAWEARPFVGYDKAVATHKNGVKRGPGVDPSCGSQQKPGFKRVQPSEGTR
jgi:hypothetical protein